MDKSLTDCQCADLDDDSAADHHIILIENRRLPCCNVPLWRVELDLGLPIFQRRDGRLRLLRRIANLDLGKEWLIWRFSRKPIDITRDQLTRTEFLLGSNHQCVCLRILSEDVQRYRRR